METKIEEIWKDVVGFEGTHQVSNLGRVKSLQGLKNNQYKAFDKPERILKGSINSDGYISISVGNSKKGKRTTIHRLVAAAFIPNPLRRGNVNHISGIKTDNRVENLEWVSHSENMLHAHKTGLIKPTCGRQKLTKADLIEIKKLFKFGFSAAKIAELYDFSDTQIRATKKRTWNYINNVRLLV